MKATFDDFLMENPNCSNYSNNPDAIAIFAFLNEDANIIKMIEFAERGKPALAGCVNELTAYYDSMQNPIIDFNEKYPRTVIGKMAKTILKPFGYRPTTQRNLPKECGDVKYFSSASCYELSAPASMRVVKRVEACN